MSASISKTNAQGLHKRLATAREGGGKSSVGFASQEYGSYVDSNRNFDKEYDDDCLKKKRHTPLKLWLMRHRTLYYLYNAIRVRRKTPRGLGVTVLLVFALKTWLFDQRPPYSQPLFPTIGRRPLDSEILPITLHPSSMLFLSSNAAAVASLPPISLSEEAEDPDYDGLMFKMLKSGTKRQIQLPYVEGRSYQQRKEMKSKFVPPYYAFDDDNVRGWNPVYRGNECKRTSFHRLNHPNCNHFHEINVLDDSGTFLSHGYFREVMGLDFGEDSAVMKMMRLSKDSLNFNLEFYEQIRMDALVMEQLSSSPRIVDIYGHCSASVLTERMVEEVQKYVVPGTGYAKQWQLNDRDDVQPMNNFTPTEKLTMALEMAETIAELHGFKDGVIVHDDIQLCQFLRDKQGTMKLNDFNRAEIMLWNEEEGDYCRYINGPAYGNYRAGEEYAVQPLNEQIDVYSMGNNIYALLTGLWVYYENNDDQFAQAMVIDGVLPFVDERYSRRSYAESALVLIMMRCWEHNPDERADIFEVVDMLRAAVAENERQSSQDFPIMDPGMAQEMNQKPPDGMHGMYQHMNQGMSQGFPQMAHGVSQGFPQRMLHGMVQGMAQEMSQETAEDIPGMSQGNNNGVFQGFPQMAHGMVQGMPHGLAQETDEDIPGIHWRPNQGVSQGFPQRMAHGGFNGFQYGMARGMAQEKRQESAEGLPVRQDGMVRGNGNGY